MGQLVIVVSNSVFKVASKNAIQKCKMGVSISDQVLPLCVRDMFADNYPQELRNDVCFYQCFAFYKQWVLKNISSLNYAASL